MSRVLDDSDKDPNPDPDSAWDGVQSTFDPACEDAFRDGYEKGYEGGYDEGWSDADIKCQSVADEARDKGYEAGEEHERENHECDCDEAEEQAYNRGYESGQEEHDCDCDDKCAEAAKEAVSEAFQGIGKSAQHALNLRDRARFSLGRALERGDRRAGLDALVEAAQMSGREAVLNAVSEWEGGKAVDGGDLQGELFENTGGYRHPFPRRQPPEVNVEFEVDRFAPFILGGAAPQASPEPTVVTKLLRTFTGGAPTCPGLNYCWRDRYMGIPCGSKPGEDASCSFERLTGGAAAGGPSLRSVSKSLRAGIADATSRGRASVKLGANKLPILEARALLGYVAMRLKGHKGKRGHKGRHQR